MATGHPVVPAASRARWLPVLLAAIGIVLAPPSALLAILLLLPTAMAWTADSSPGRATTRAVMLFGLAASCGPFDMLWRSGHRLDAAITLITDLRVVSIAWAAQAGGWLLTQLLPLIVGAWFESEIRLGVIRLETRKNSLLEEWGSGGGA